MATFKIKKKKPTLPDNFEAPKPQKEQPTATTTKLRTPETVDQGKVIDTYKRGIASTYKAVTNFGQGSTQPSYGSVPAYNPEVVGKDAQPGQVTSTYDSKTGSTTLDFGGSQDSISLTEAEATEYNKYKNHPENWQYASPKISRALQMTQANKTAGLTSDIVSPDIEQRNIYASTLREGFGQALATGGATALAGAIAGGASTGPLAPIGAGVGAAIGFAVGAIGSLYKSYIGNQKEEVSNAFKGFQSIKIGVAAQLAGVRSGAISAAQASINMQYIEQRLNYYESILRQKQAAGGFISDVSDYDGKMAYMMEWRNLYYSSVKAQITASFQNNAYIPMDIIAPPDYEDMV